MIPDNKLAAALVYLDLGWSIIPLRVDDPKDPREAKKPPKGFKWTKYKKRRPTVDELRDWFDRTDFGLAVVFGPVSDHLACRDFDDEESYRAWAAAFPEFAAKLPTVKTVRPNGGYHVHFQLAIAEADVRIQLKNYSTKNGAIDLGDGELRLGKGCYCALPPTRIGRRRYQWLGAPALPIPAVDPIAVGLARSWHQPAAAATVARNERLSKRSQLDASHHGGSFDFVEGRGREDKAHTHLLMPLMSPVSTAPTVLRNGRSVLRVSSNAAADDCPSASDMAAVVRQYLPTQQGERHRRLFDLARALRSLPGAWDKRPEDFRGAFNDWYAAARSVIGTKVRITNWGEFCSSWERVEHPHGDEPIRIAFAASQQRPPPVCADDYADAPAVQDLLRLCAELQRIAGDGSFYLGTRAVGELLGVHFGTVCRWLTALQHDGILQLVSKGNRRTHKASEYHYLGDMPGLDDLTSEDCRKDA